MKFSHATFSSEPKRTREHEMETKTLAKLTPETSLKGFAVKAMWVAQFVSQQAHPIGIEGPFDSEDETIMYIKEQAGLARPKLVTVVTNGSVTYIVNPDPLTKKS